MGCRTDKHEETDSRVDTYVHVVCGGTIDT